MAPTLRFNASVYPAGTRHLPHSHDELQLSLVLGGRLVERVGNTIEHAGALSVVVKDPSITHADEFGEAGVVMARLAGYERSFAELADPGADAPVWRWSHDPSVAAPFLHLVRRAALGEHSFACDDGDVVELLARLTTRESPRPSGEPPAWLRRAMEQLREGGESALSVREVARSAGVHPVYLARAIRRWYGTSPAEELRRARLHRAADGIAHPVATISAVAHRSGFADEPHLCRTFGQTTGLTPGRYRRLVSRIQGLSRRSA